MEKLIRIAFRLMVLYAAGSIGYQLGYARGYDDKKWED